MIYVSFFCTWVWPIFLGVLLGHYFARARIAERRLKKITVASALMLEAYELGEDHDGKDLDTVLTNQANAYKASNYMTRVYGEPRGRRLTVEQIVLALADTQEEMRK